MTSTMWAAAPAGYLRVGACALPPAVDSVAPRSTGAVRTVAPVSRVQGTGVSVAVLAAREVDLVGGTGIDGGTALPTGTAVASPQKFHNSIGTTLGIPSSRRPVS